MSPIPVNSPNDNNARRMKSWLPPLWYDQSYVTNAVLESEGQGLTVYQSDLGDVIHARMPQTAPEWGLQRFEEELGLTVSPLGMSDADRRSRIMARFRGIGTTIYRLKQVASTWGYGGIAIQPGIEDWTLYIGFTELMGIPADISSHQIEIRNNVEAHLNIVWLAHLTLWQEVKNTGVLWCQLKTAGITWAAMKTTPYMSLPFNVACPEPTGMLTIEVVDSTGLGNLYFRYYMPDTNGNPILGPAATDPVSFPLD